jgi:hypothetical protein
VRSRSPSVLVPGAAPALPPPPQRPRLTDALRAGEEDDDIPPPSLHGDSAPAPGT